MTSEDISDTKENRSARRSVSSVRKKLLFSLITLGTLALILELVLRSCGLAPTGVITVCYIEDGDEGYYEPAPNQILVNNIVPELPHEVTVNAMSMRRTDEIDLEDKNVTRFVCIGDSYTWGTGVNDWETYPHYLEGMLNASGESKRYEVLNGGIVGTTISDQHVKYRLRFAAIEHEALLLLIAKGDIREHLVKQQNARLPVMVKSTNPWVLVVKKKLNRLAMVNAFKFLRMKYFFKPYTGDTPPRLLVRAEDRDKYLGRLDAVVDLGRQRCGCVVLGYIGGLDEDYRAVEAYSQKKNLPFMAFESYKAIHGSHLKTDLKPYDGHFNKTGNRMLARMFLELLMSTAPVLDPIKGEESRPITSAGR
ncbi:SGNH/GDSL hydrolase family protein [Acidobacteriota bacterium]